MIKSWNDANSSIMLWEFFPPLTWEAHSIVMNSLRQPFVPYIHSESSLTFPFKAFPNNMTSFSCAPTEPSIWRITIHRLSVSASLIFHNVGTWLKQRWSLGCLRGPDSRRCETVQTGSHTLSCPNDHQYHQSPKWNPLMWYRKRKHH